MKISVLAILTSAWLSSAAWADSCSAVCMDGSTCEALGDPAPAAVTESGSALSAGRTLKLPNGTVNEKRDLIANADALLAVQAEAGTGFAEAYTQLRSARQHADSANLTAALDAITQLNATLQDQAVSAALPGVVCSCDGQDHSASCRT